MNLYKNKKIKNLYGFLTAFSLILIILSYLGLFKTIPVFEIFTTTIGQSTSSLKTNFSAFFIKFEDNERLSKENIALRKENIDLENKAGKADAIQKDLDSLKNFNNVTSLKQKSIVTHSISITLSNKLPVQINIDKGENDGLKAGQVVVNDTGSLIGLVDSVSKYTAVIKPYYLYDDVKFPIKSSSTDTALIQGVDGDKILGNNLGQSDIQVGESFYTSSLGDKMPEGIYIGKVASLNQDDKKVFTIDTDILNNNILYIYL